MGTALSTGNRGTRDALVSWWRSRYGAQLLFEIAISAGLLIAYRLIRMVNKTDLTAAFANARDVVRFEEWLGLPFEDNLQALLLDNTTIIKLLNHYYIWFHFPAAIALLLWLYFWHSDRYRPTRNLMAVVTFAALIIHLLYPLAPPRMMNGFVDTMQVWGPNIYPPNATDGAANQIAAMPSLHFGWAMIEAMAVISILTTRWRWLVLLHPTLMTLAIIATANHWWVDAAVAGMIVLVTLGLFRLGGWWVGDRQWSWARFRFVHDLRASEVQRLAKRGLLVPEEQLRRATGSEPVAAADEDVVSLDGDRVG